MKKFIFALLGLLFTAGLSYGQNVAATTVANTANMPVVSFKKSIHDFGRVEAGKPVTAEFTFTNTGNVPLSITSVTPSCGCTVSSYTQEPVQPGKSGFIKATYNAKSAGPFNKSIAVITNATPSNLQLFIKGEVVEKNN